MAEKQYVIFKLNDEEYGIEITNVREITEYNESTKVPNCYDFIDGIINLRGNVVPVINLKKRFNLEETKINNNSRVVIISIAEKQVGFIVDDASHVLTLDEKDIEETPEIISGVDKKYIVGIGKKEEKIIILLNLEAILSENEKKKIKEIEIKDI